MFFPFELANQTLETPEREGAGGAGRVGGWDVRVAEGNWVLTVTSVLLRFVPTKQCACACVRAGQSGT